MRVSLENLTDDELSSFDEAIELAKRYEDAPSGELLEVMERSSIINWDEDAPAHLYGQRVALVPLPQQSET